ncbi:MAG: hypothetical protein AAGC47_00435 [Bacteroidota bacterium]
MKTLNQFLQLLFAFLLTQICIGQEKFTSDQFAQHTYGFTVEKGKIQGNGAQVLSDAIENSQFFLLGEYHNEAGISELTSALLPLLANEGYGHFAIETGPHSAEKLEKLGKTGDVEAALNKFYTSHLTLTGDIPIPFFGGIEDAEFLEIAMKNGYDLWGLDQEYLGGYLFLLEQAWLSSRLSEKYRTEYEVCRKKITEYYASVTEEESSEIYNQIINDEYIQDFLDELQKSVCRWGFNAVDELRASTEIYHDWKADLLDNLEGRTDLMKGHFIEYYKFANERFPKVFVKMGGMHTARGMTGNADYELGNMLHELAAFNGMTDVNVAFATRYFLEENGEIGDNLDFDSEWTENMEPILAQGDKELWKIIDLRPLRKMWINDRVKPNRQIKKYLMQNDYIIIMPARGENTPNYDISLASE